MTSRAIRAALLAGTACTAMILAAPTAAAVELAPGVRCDGAECVNDNDEAYVVYGQVTCSVLTTPPWTDLSQPAPPPTPTVQYQGWSMVLEPHTTGTVRAGCAGGLDMGWTLGGADPQSRPPTGSAG
ncbi:hypothetical protein [Nocardia neocaledoniensis]|uniref:Secreted protein n=1 Tax=Nocardia neocaledoniensis TaxID=236511 RepID=A0A317P038_9NOCA|nr:hypothetical protein [Nocardia neocaledoniensis]PWV79588.1 hypothetical protein DFR69_102653 [Nocardia neocaledoniensis]